MCSETFAGPGLAHCGWVLTSGKGRGRHFRDEFGGPRGFRGAPPFGGPPFGGPPFARGRGRARRGDVRLAVLMLLSEEPRNGYGMMQAIEERSDGRWRPSPGSMYPALSQLEDEGYIRAVQADGGRVYELSDAGREHLESRGDTPPPWQLEDESASDTFRELKSLMIGIGKAVWQVAHDGDEQELQRAIELLAETRRGLYRILAEEPRA
ncbi:MAG: PadR family transcriptional regulator [Solirubrobacteraceae bacterium]